MSLLQDLADEAGEELNECLTNKRTIKYKGRNIEVYYNEHRCRWYAFVMGIGDHSSADGSDDGAIERAKRAIERQAEFDPEYEATARTF